MIISQTPPVKRASALYNTQKVYGERIKEFKKESPPMVQTQADAVTISQVGMQSLAVHKKVKDEKKPVAYSNPRVDNNPDFIRERRSLLVPLARAAL